MRIRTSPGEILREEFMKPLGLSGNELARQLKVPANRINDIVRDRREISADTALCQRRSKTRPCGGAKVGHFGSVRSLSP